jgi:hypothetical protein
MSDVILKLYIAAAHQWGPGKVHAFKDSEKFWCGNQPKYAPGRPTSGAKENISCLACQKAMDSEEKRTEQKAKWDEYTQAQELEREQRNREWWTQYDVYLSGPIWAAKRKEVLKRCGGLCEGCRSNPATEIHHLAWTYPQGTMPGSEQWVRQEKLFQLVGLCRECHSDLHPEKLGSSSYG